MRDDNVGRWNIEDGADGRVLRLQYESEDDDVYLLSDVLKGSWSSGNLSSPLGGAATTYKVMWDESACLPAGSTPSDNDNANDSNNSNDNSTSNNHDSGGGTGDSG